MISVYPTHRGAWPYAGSHSNSEADSPENAPSDAAVAFQEANSRHFCHGSLTSLPSPTTTTAAAARITINNNNRLRYHRVFTPPLGPTSRPHRYTFARHTAAVVGATAGGTATSTTRAAVSWEAAPFPPPLLPLPRPQQEHHHLRWAGGWMQKTRGFQGVVACFLRDGEGGRAGA